MRGRERTGEDGRGRRRTGEDRRGQTNNTSDTEVAYHIMTLKLVGEDRRGQRREDPRGPERPRQDRRTN